MKHPLVVALALSLSAMVSSAVPAATAAPKGAQPPAQGGQVENEVVTGTVVTKRPLGKGPDPLYRGFETGGVEVMLRTPDGSQVPVLFGPEWQFLSSVSPSGSDPISHARPGQEMMIIGVTLPLHAESQNAIRSKPDERPPVVAQELKTEGQTFKPKK